MSPLRYKMLECPELTSNLYLPVRQKIKGAVLVLHGSEGGGFGVHDMEAQFLAAHGFAALAHSWCGSPASPIKGIPAAVIDIDLQRTVDALRWLKNRPELKRKKVAIYGFSRGAEQALILAAMSGQYSEIPKPDAVAVLAPSHVYVSGFSWAWKSEGGSAPDDSTARAWRWRGRVVGSPGKAIPIERFNRPVLLSHGMDDELWPVTRSKRLEQRLKHAQRSVETEYLPAEKHVLSAKGRHAHRIRLYAFLQKTLTGSRSS